MASWVKNFDSELVCQRISEITIIRDDGTVAYTGFGHTDGFVLLSSMVKLKEGIPSTEKKRIIRKAVNSTAKSGEISPQRLMASLKRAENAYIAQPLIKYRLFSSISVYWTCELKNLEYGGSRITFNPKSLKALECHSTLLKEAKQQFISDLPSNYKRLSVSVSARSTSEAVDSGLDRLDFVRGLWNFWSNRRAGFRTSFGNRQPVNKFILGPIHTLHFPDGSLATDGWWYEPHYQGGIKLYRDSGQISEMYKYTQNARRSITSSNYCKELVNAVLRYVRALDLRNWEDSFLLLWGVLELLTGTLSDSYKTTIRRAASMFTDHEYAQQVLTHLKEGRNRYVHAAVAPDEIETVMYQLKWYVEVLLDFHIRSSYKFKSIPDAAEFMDYPLSNLEISERIRKLEYARKLRST